MRIWLVADGETLPMDGENPRLFRMGMLADMLSSRGHTVVWWTSTHDHYKKIFRAKKDTDIQIKPNYIIKMLHGCGYKKNRSLSRILHHRQIAKKFLKFTETEIKPDLILSALPTIEFAKASAAFGHDNSIPVLLDLRDMWPDLYVEMFPVCVRWFFRLLFDNQFRMMRCAAKQATALIGLSSSFLDWGLQYAKRDKNKYDAVFSMAYLSSQPDEKSIKEADEFWKTIGLSKANNNFVITFIGSLSPTHQLEKVIQTVKKMDRSVTLIIGGIGDLLPKYKSLADGSENIIFSGWLDRAKIWSLIQRSSVGLVSYINRQDFNTSLSNKAIEYLSAGLPIITSLNDGSVLVHLLTQYQCGFNFNDHSFDSLLDVIEKLRNDPALLKKMSQNAKAVYETKFRAEKVYGDMCDHLEYVVEQFYSV